jgi:glutaredoxin 3
MERSVHDKLSGKQQARDRAADPRVGAEVRKNIRVGENNLRSGVKEVATMKGQRKVELFSAGCPACREAEELVRRMSCPSCEVQVLDMKDGAVASRAREFGIRSVPAVVVDGKVAECCAGRGPDETTLRAAEVGKPL